MPPTIAQDVASIIVTRAEGFLEQYEGSGVINLTPAQKQAIGRELVDDRMFYFDLQGNKICLCSPEWKRLPENIGKRWITVLVHEHNRKMGPRSARYTEYQVVLTAWLNTYQEQQHMTNPLLAYNGVLFCKNVTARCEVPGDIRYELFESFLTAKWSICTDCGSGRPDENMIGTVCSRCYTSKCMGASVKRLKITD